jgi:hypothetical protein
MRAAGLNTGHSVGYIVASAVHNSVDGGAQKAHRYRAAVNNPSPVQGMLGCFASAIKKVLSKMPLRAAHAKEEETEMSCRQSGHPAPTQAEVCVSSSASRTRRAIEKFGSTSVEKLAGTSSQ